ncbi:MAG: superoxide dismutase, Ni [Proteobacteria bacterium]|nr:superoxide dismutase, Ni [Pseudomonadota bacterium]MBU1585432.1 superoxide dismutase, Ni [Pseudomonadota bacterium]MBU2454651.1 superoxide dismutase, Ni [Pseudomonadota bacterium]MBU2629226.1 superoxide dismutase, Ni [Pseudomonadota bacterium]
MKKTMLKNVLISVLAVAGWVSAVSTAAYAHCQIPCGIYDDHARVEQMLEDSATILKATKLIAELSGKTDAQSQNQLVRWIMNKEKHAQNIIFTISDYFLTQRVNDSQKDYVERLKKHHSVIVAAMKAKQNADASFALALQKSIEELAPYYPDHE